MALRMLPVLALLNCCGVEPTTPPVDLPPTTTEHPADPPPPDEPPPTEPIDPPPPPAQPLRIHFLGVMGFVLQHGDDVVLTAPLFTRASELDVSIGRDVLADGAAIDAGLRGDDLGRVSAIISGHAHYDHLLDVPHVMTNQAPSSTLYSNVSGRNVLAAYAPDRSEQCTGAPVARTISRDRVVAVDDALASAVDYRNCPDARPPGAPLTGSWIRVPNSRVRLYPICGQHPDQFLFYHFANGDVDEEQCDVPSAATRWKEGNTITFLIDFLNDDDEPVFRVYYQDAPSDGPSGHPPADVLADKAVDVALLCVGTYDQVRAQPEEVVSALTPRYGLSGHWEDFFQPLDRDARPLPFMDLDAYESRADAALAGPPDQPIVVDGVPQQRRHIVAAPDARFVIERAVSGG